MKALDQLLDTVTAAQFQTLDNGDKVFFPNGATGGAYRIADEATYVRVRRSMQRYWLWFMAYIVIGGPIWSHLFRDFEFVPGMALFVGALSLGLVAYFMAVKRLVAELPRSDARYSIKEADQRLAAATPRWLTISTIVISLLFVLLGLQLVLTPASTSDWFVGLVCLGMFGTLLAYSIYSLVRRPQQNGHAG